MSSLTDSGTVLAWTTSGSPIGIAWNAVLFLFATIGFAHCVGLLSAKPAAAPRVSVSDTHTDPEPLSKARTAAAPEPAGLQPSPFVFPAPNSDESWPCPRARTVASLREALALVPASVFDSTVAASAAQAARASPPEWERWATDRGLLLPPTDPGAPLRLALPSFSPVSPCLSGAVPGLGADAGLPVSPVSQAVGRRVPTVHMLCGMICSGKSSIAKTLARRHNAVIYSPDTWILYLFGPSFPIERFSLVGDQVKELIWRAAQESMARYGVDVILDFSLWGRKEREQWRRRIRSDAARWYAASDAHAHAPAVGSGSDPSAAAAAAAQPAVRIQLHYASCPLEESRRRLTRRNAAVEATRTRLQARAAAAAAAAACAAAAGGADTASDAALDAVAFSGDDLNLHVPLEAFDGWKGFLEPPGPEEEPIVYDCAGPAAASPLPTAEGDSA